MNDMEFYPDQMRARIREAYKELGYTNENKFEVENGLGVGYMANILRKGQLPGVDKLHLISRGLNVSVAYLMYGTDIPPHVREMLDLKDADPKKFYQILALLS